MITVPFVAAALSFLVAPITQAPSRASSARAQLTPLKEDPVQEGTAMVWQTTAEGFKYVDQIVGSGQKISRGSVISLHYEVSFATNSMVLGTSRTRLWPFTFAWGKHEVPIFEDALEGMRVGGKRRLTVPASAIPESQIANVPHDQEGEPLTFEIEVCGVVTGALAIIPSMLPPGTRRITIARTLFMLSFVPYFLPDNIKPAIYQEYDGKDPEVVRAAREQERTGMWLGGGRDALDSFDALFPPP